MLNRIDTLKTYAVLENEAPGSIDLPLHLEPGIYVFRFTYSANYYDLEQKVAFFNLSEGNGQGCTLRNTDGKIISVNKAFMLAKGADFCNAYLPETITIHKIEVLAD